ncbi:5'-deoxynucleotidase, partial [Tremellales sp. Uapishka_1]
MGAGGKPLPELYKSTGNEVLDTLAFLHLLEQLKVQKRSGWIREGVKEPESISDHMCRMALMAMMIPVESSRPLDVSRCVMMALVHDLAEAHVGDITPVEGVPAHVKHELEQAAMDSFLSEMLGGDGNKDARERFRSLWDEYEARETPESKLVKDLDRLELALQAVEYERCASENGQLRYCTDDTALPAQDIQSLHPFFTGSIPHLEHPAIQKWGEALMEERRQLWISRGREKEERDGLGGVKVGDLARRS